MYEMNLFLYAYDKDGEQLDDVSDEITCTILDEYVIEHKNIFDLIKTEKTYLRRAKELAGELIELLKTTDYGTQLAKISEVSFVMLTVEYVDGPAIDEWVIWDRKKKNLTIK